MNNQSDDFWHGFDAAIELVGKVLEDFEGIELDQWACLIDSIDEEIQAYKRDE